MEWGTIPPHSMRILLAEDDEIFNDTDEQVDVEEDDATQGNDEYHQGEDWKQEGSHLLESKPPTRVERDHEMIVPNPAD